jgi:hypothetical protein
MLTIEKIDTGSKAQVNRFVRLPFRLYKNDPLWVPPILIDNEGQLNRKKNPFFEHSDADFFIAVRDGRDVGRLAALENKRFNDYHGTHEAEFYYFESEDDQEIANALFEAHFDWSRQRGLNRVVGPKGLSPLDGYGILVEGFDGHQMMTMMNYNPPSYPRMLETLGFTKEVDFISCFADAAGFKVPERAQIIAERVEQRGTLQVRRFTSIKELKKWTRRIGELYNKAYVNNWEYYPLTEREMAYIVETLETIADPKLIKIITHGEDVVGFLFAFPDLSNAIRRSGGRLLPFGLLDMLLEMRRTKWVAVNSAGVLPEFHGRGGNALLYTEMIKTILDNKFEHGALYQVAETAVNMRRDLENLGLTPYKNHRVYQRQI